MICHRRLFLASSSTSPPPFTGFRRPSVLFLVKRLRLLLSEMVSLVVVPGSLCGRDSGLPPFFPSSLQNTLADYRDVSSCAVPVLVSDPAEIVFGRTRVGCCPDTVGRFARARRRTVVATRPFVGDLLRDVRLLSDAAESRWFLERVGCLSGWLLQQCGFRLVG